MSLRIGTSSNFARVLFGLRYNQAKLFTGQQQVATGRRILRPSDDPIGTARSLSLGGRIAQVARQREAVRAGQSVVDAAAASLQDAGQLLSDARTLVVQAMNGTLSVEDRESLASELEALRQQLLSLANTQVDDRHLFGGTRSSAPPWAESAVGGMLRVGYAGDDGEQLVRIGQDVDLAINVPGSELFAALEWSGTAFAGVTGLSGGTTADEGTGYEYVRLRHDATDPGALASVGIALGGGGDTLLGAHELVVDAAAGTVRLGDGPPVPLPEPGPEAGTVAVANGQGGLLHLDLSGWTGADLTTTVAGQGSISIDGSSWTSLSFTETDLALVHEATGSTVHVDTTGVGRAGTEVVQFGGAVNAFDALQGAVEDLRDPTLSAKDVGDRLGLRLSELDRNHQNLLVGVGVLGSRGARLQKSDLDLVGVDLQLQGLLSDTRDADLAEAVVEMARAEQTLRLAQATGVRLIQRTLLDFLR